MESRKLAVIGTAFGIYRSQTGKTIIYDTRAETAKMILALNDNEMRQLVDWFVGQRCPICFTRTRPVEVLCGECLDNAM